ncbi:MAG: glycosyltransferase [bacterium]|nr:MAG: glycosyltransferase [bacterium]
MKLLIIDTYYQGFLDSFYKKQKIDRLSFKNHRQLLLNQFFGTGDSYSYYLKKLGHNAEELIVNDYKLQSKWAKENDIEVNQNKFLSKLQMMPLLHRIIGRPDWIQNITLAQIRKYSPDVVYMQDLSILNPDSLKKIKKYCKLLVGQIACPLPNEENLKQFDLILTSFPHYVKRFKKMGINSEYFKIGFDPRVLKIVGKQPKKYDVTFIGGISPSHKKGLKLLNYVASKIKLDVWGYGKEFLLPTSKLYKYHHGEAWSLDMYKLLAQSKITINRHIDVAENYANNMRLYEATGMGAMLLTDKKDNLKNLFEIGKEVIEYSDQNDLIKKINYHLKHDRDRLRISSSGQTRTLNDHTYYVRITELSRILQMYA